MMLGVRQPGVTVAIQALEREGVIARKRGCIVITNRKAHRETVQRELRPGRQLALPSDGSLERKFVDRIALAVFDDEGAVLA